MLILLLQMEDYYSNNIESPFIEHLYIFTFFSLGFFSFSHVVFYVLLCLVCVCILVKVGFLIPLYESQESNSGQQIWWKVLLPDESPHLPSISIFKLV